MRSTVLGLAVWTLLAGCSKGEGMKKALARETFATFQRALFDRDRKALRRLVCYDARDAVPGLCAVELAGREPLSVLGVEQRGHEYRVLVSDPNKPPTDRADDSFYVLTVEDGQMRVDLLQTARYMSRPGATSQPNLEASPAMPAFTPGKLTPAQLREAERIQREAAQPGR